MMPGSAALLVPIHAVVRQARPWYGSMHDLPTGCHSFVVWQVADMPHDGSSPSMSASPSLCVRECIMATRAEAPSAMSSAGGQRAITSLRSVMREIVWQLEGLRGLHWPIRWGQIAQQLENKWQGERMLRSAIVSCDIFSKKMTASWSLTVLLVGHTL